MFIGNDQKVFKCKIILFSEYTGSLVDSVIISCVNFKKKYTADAGNY